MDFKDITYNVTAGVATVTLNRPDKLNAIGLDTTSELERAFEAASSDDGVRVLVITGAGRGFCSGADLSVVDKDPADRIGRLVDKSPAAGGIRTFSLQLQNFEKPTIAAVNGPVAGMGLSLAMACDIRIASDKATFTPAFVRKGLIPDRGFTYFLPRLVGLAKACEIVFMGEPLDAQSALACGLVNRVAPHDQLMQVTEEVVAKIASSPPRAMKLAKRALYRGASSDLATAMDFEGFLQGTCLVGDEFKQVMAAYSARQAEPRQ